ncbi:MAG: undecaprenyl-phosphate galactose phosphotransferase WbaP [Nitrospirae bacterium]|nr:undecaprenyl-phosphate galactose phosphotransferase WbaP [Nitrospirota bacterium]
MKKFIQVCSLILIDIAAYYGSLYLSWHVRENLLPFFFTFETANYSFYYYIRLWWIPAIFVFFIANQQIYTARTTFWDENKKLFHAITLAFVVLMAVVTLGRIPGLVSRPVLVCLWLFSFFVYPVFHLYGKKLLFQIGICKEKVLVLGAGKTGKLISKGLARETHIGYDVIGYLDDDTEKIGTYIDGKKVFGSVRHYTKFVKELRINTIIIAMPSLGPELTSSMAFEIQQKVKNTLIVPNLYGVALLNTELMHLFYEEIFLLKVRNNLKYIVNRVLKRVFDLIVSLALMPFVLVLMTAFGIAIKLQSAGPIIYSHERIGRNGKLFKCYKFRTMVKDSEDLLTELLNSNQELREKWEKYWKLPNDPRITRIGAFLRKTSLDELPQIFNVLGGSMSLVGPRPYLLREMDAIKDHLDAITTVAPGITGLWQVSGRNNTTYENRIRLDIWYIMNWSLWLDVFILLRTIKVVLSMKGVS